MRETRNFLFPNKEWIPPTPIASITIDPKRYSHLLVYDDYCKIAIGNRVSPNLNENDCLTIIKEIEELPRIIGSNKSKLSAVKYTTTTIKIGQCVLLGEEGYNGLLKALKVFYNKGPYIDDSIYINTDGINQVIYKNSLSGRDLYTWWSLGEAYGYSSLQLEIIGPYERYYYSFTDISFITRLSDAIKTLLNTDIREIKLDISTNFHHDDNMRVFKQMVADEPAVCISTDIIMSDQRSLIFISKDNGLKFLQFLKEAKTIIDK